MSTQNFDFRLVRDELRSVLAALSEKLEREWPQKYNQVDGAKETLLPFIRVSINTFETILFICSDRNDGSNRQEVFAASVPPLTRSLLEALFSIIYLLDDLEEKVKEFDRSLFKEQKRFLASSKEHYAGVPKWEDYFVTMAERLDEFGRFLIGRGELNLDEVANLDKIREFPKVSKVISRLESKGSTVGPFLRYLDDLHYRELSFQSHLEPSGVVELQPIFFSTDAAKVADAVSDFKSKQIYLATAIILALASEIEIDCEFGLRSRLSYLWVILNSGSDVCEEIYSLRYQAKLTPSGG